MKARILRVGIVAALAPAIMGTLLSLIWMLAGEKRQIFFSASLYWLPAVIGFLILVLLLPAVLAWWLSTRSLAKVREQTVREQLASRRRLIARLDHEIKNPIQGIRAALADEPSQRQRASIDAQSRRLASLLADLRKIGEVEHTELEISQIDTSQLVHDALQTAREVPGAAEREFTISLPTAPRPLPGIRGDEDLLFLSIVNVLSNAVKYSRPGDAIEVRGRATDDQVVLDIADTGRGIPEEELELVWEELGRASDARGIEGSGLGLPMVRAIVERHGGKATLNSWYGEGTSVTLTLPIAGPTSAHGK